MAAKSRRRINPDQERFERILEETAKAHAKPTAICAKCRKRISTLDYLVNDFYCNECVAHANEFPLASTSGIQLTP